MEKEIQIKRGSKRKMVKEIVLKRGRQRDREREIQGERKKIRIVTQTFH